MLKLYQKVVKLYLIIHILNRLKLRTQLLLLMLVMLSMSVIAFTYLHYLNEAAILDLMEDQINELSRAIQVSYEQLTAEANTDEARLSEYINQLKRKGIKEISILSNDQEIIASTDPHRKGTKLSVSKNEFVVRTVLGENDGSTKKLYNIIIPITVKNHRMGYVHISMYVEDFEKLSKATHIKRLIITFMIFGIGFLFSIVIAYKFTSPISSLIKGARKIVEGRLEPFTGRYTGELADLVDSFNSMVLKLKERNEMQERLKKSEQQAILGQIASGIAHEIRNPMNFINLSLDHILTQFKKGFPQDEIESLIFRIKEEIGRVNQMLINFLNLGKEPKIYLVKIKGEVVLEEVLHLVSPRLRTQQIELVKDYCEPIPEVLMDIDKTKSVFINVLNNSIDALPNGGTIKVSILKEGGFIIYRFEDNGCGIKKEDLEKIFEPYFTTKKNGIGLGLSISERVVKAHGGEINVESQAGKGTVVTVKIPC